MEGRGAHGHGVRDPGVLRLLPAGHGDLRNCLIINKTKKSNVRSFIYRERVRTLSHPEFPGSAPRAGRALCGLHRLPRRGALRGMAAILPRAMSLQDPSPRQLRARAATRDLALREQGLSR